MNFCNFKWIYKHIHYTLQYRIDTINQFNVAQHTNVVFAIS